MKSHNDLSVYQKSLDLVETIYSLTKDFPVEEKFGLTTQLRRASVSITFKHRRRSWQAKQKGVCQVSLYFYRVIS